MKKSRWIQQPALMHACAECGHHIRRGDWCIRVAFRDTRFKCDLCAMEDGHGPPTIYVTLDYIRRVLSR